MTMKLRILLIAALACAALSCDKARKVAREARAAVRAEIAADAGEKPDPALEKLVDRTADGVRFRKDLPFPARLDVTTTRRLKLDVRTFRATALGKESGAIKATETSVTKLERAAGHVRYTPVSSATVAPGAEEPAAAAPAKPGEPRTYRKSGGKWHAEGGGLLAPAATRDIAPVFEQLLIENALAPRKRWFGPKRWKPGDKMTLSGDSLPLLVAGGATGSLDLELESFEPVDGHPCAVFSVTGSYSRKNFADFESDFSDEEVTIQAGKFWLSLIYPAILREEAETIRTYRTGGRGDAGTRIQGQVGVSIVRAWKIPATTEAPKK
jgi:hypothetical protein